MKYLPQITIGISAFVAILALIFYFQETSPEITENQAQSVTVVSEEPATPSGTETAQPVQPSTTDVTPESTNETTTEASIASDGYGINLARIRPDGSAIVAGNAAAGSTINLIKDGQVIGSAVTSDQGEWVIVPDMLLGKGSHLLTIEIINPDGSKQIGDMALAIEMIDRQETPLVALVPYTEEAANTATLLQVPETIDPSSTSADDANSIAAEDTDANITPVIVITPRVTIRSIQALNAKTMSISGNAEANNPKGVSVDVMVDGVLAATVKADDQAMYAAMVAINPDKQTITLKSILRDDQNNAIASARINLSQSQIAQGLDGNALIVVQKGDALWRIAYKTYGAGIRYVDIVRQNPEEINDPDLIYPDQIFVIPNG